MFIIHMYICSYQRNPDDVHNRLTRLAAMKTRIKTNQIVNKQHSLEYFVGGDMFRLVWTCLNRCEHAQGGVRSPQTSFNDLVD